VRDCAASGSNCRKDAGLQRAQWCDPAEHVTVCCGATECMMATMLAVIDPGDEVVIFQPYYENYSLDALNAEQAPPQKPKDRAANKAKKAARQAIQTSKAKT